MAPSSELPPESSAGNRAALPDALGGFWTSLDARAGRRRGPKWSLKAIHWLCDQDTEAKASALLGGLAVALWLPVSRSGWLGRVSGTLWALAGADCSAWKGSSGRSQGEDVHEEKDEASLHGWHSAGGGEGGGGSCSCFCCCCCGRTASTEEGDVIHKGEVKVARNKNTLSQSQYTLHYIDLHTQTVFSLLPFKTQRAAQQREQPDAFYLKSLSERHRRQSGERMEVKGVKGRQRRGLTREVPKNAEVKKMTV